MPPMPCPAEAVVQVGLMMSPGCRSQSVAAMEASVLCAPDRGYYPEQPVACSTCSAHLRTRLLRDDQVRPLR